ncbi:hypothetical protein GCM10022232_46800 [Streptomyces plumbiresistens]|uniref:Uncharacterized protein n=1 Tax=Streptomyces plumbiresistens TaxID=511811 RepID=A0ABP7RVD3_9ACTN
MRGPDPLRNTAPPASAGRKHRYAPLNPRLRQSGCNKLTVVFSTRRAPGGTRAATAMTLRGATRPEHPTRTLVPRELPEMPE